MSGHQAVITIANPGLVWAELDESYLGAFASEQAARDAIVEAMRERYGLVLAPGEVYSR